MDEWIASTMSTLGYWGVAFLMFVENVFPPIPSELIMPLAGFTVGRGEMTLWGVILAGSVGSVAGQFPLYYLGHKLGQTRLHRLADRHGKWLTISGDNIDKATDWLHRRGAAAVFLCRLIPGIRSLISIPAGVGHMNLLKFTAYSTAGILIWSSILAGIGYLLGENYQVLQEYLGGISTWIWVILVAALLGWIGWRLRGCLRHSKADCPLRDTTQEAKKENTTDSIETSDEPDRS
jgi:membrane protein DedA with SNARE-associated domain